MYIYKAEYISQNGSYYLNVDLGFNRWKVIPFKIEEEPKPPLKTRDQIVIATTKDTKAYKCKILERP